VPDDDEVTDKKEAQARKGDFLPSAEGGCAFKKAVNSQRSYTKIVQVHFQKEKKNVQRHF